MNTHIICASPVSSINTHAQQCIGVHPMTTGTNKDIPKVSGMTVPTIVSTAQGSKKARIQCTSTRTAKGKNHILIYSAVWLIILTVIVYGCNGCVFGWIQRCLVSS